ncbi:MAG: YihY/virulence factor BrkB family protein [Actinomycetota bacterium]|nr:YihY/virulence factor BrkB family protein [Actinomycetota bacterium]
MPNLAKTRILITRYIKNLINEFISDGTMMLASSIAYYFLFSIFPLMLILISFSGFVIDTLNIQTTILDFIQERIPIIYDFTESNIESTIQNRRSIGIIGIVFLLVATTYVFDSIQFALNKIYGTESQRKFWQQKAFGILIISMVFVLLLLSFLSSTVLLYLAQNIFDLINITEDISQTLIKALSLVVGLVFNFSIFCLIYFFGTNRRINFKNIYRGALFGTIAWEITKHVFLIYLDQFANFELAYGSVGSMIGFLLWVYISSLILLIGAQINSLSLK